ncbi:MAG: tetratricopeptide repeat protein [Fimbriimonadaceae bacterium]|nr:tetratricopeptide repeat protein [Fimbriimonadaceae bacterium]
MGRLPTGTVTLLMTDVERSTLLWEEAPEAMNDAIARHDEIVRQAVERYQGHLLKARGEGDSLFAVFASAAEAVAAAADLQDALEVESWPEGAPIRVRAALHTGEAFAREGDYYGSTVNRCARLRACAHGGQTLLTNSTRVLVGERLPTGATLLDLDVHRLKDLLRPEHVFELQRAGQTDAFPPIRSLAPSRHNLPVQLTSFVGREREVAEVCALLGRARLVTLLGPGGAGKTRLSLQVAAESIDQFADGVWQVDLSSVADGSLVADAFASAFGVSNRVGAGALERVTEHLEPLQLLIVLDNCEHLTASVAPIVSDILTRCGGATVLATSRQRLGVAGEFTIRVGPLRLPKRDEAEEPESALAFESIRLFCDRAEAHDAAFRLGLGNVGAVAELCRRLDGIPLAIELIASNVGEVSPKQILDRWTDTFPTLASDDSQAAERHQTLRKSIDWSTNRLPANEQELFARLSVFSGGWTLDASEAVCADDGLPRDSILPLLQRLVRVSLVHVEETLDGEHRYRFLETVRQYAAERGASDSEPLQARHFAWCLGLAREADPKLGGPEQAVWLDRLEPERDNFRRALDWAVRGRHSEAISLAHALRRLWLRRGPLREGLRWMEAALEACPEAQRPLRAHTLNAMGAFYDLDGNPSVGRKWYEQSLVLWREEGDLAQIAALLTNLAIVASREARSEDAHTLFAEGIEAYRSLGDEGGRASAEMNLGMCLVNEGRFEEAVEQFDRSIPVLRAQGIQARLGIALGDRAVARKRLGREEESVEDLVEAFGVWRAVGDRLASARGLLLLAEIALARDLDRLAAEILGAETTMIELAGVDDSATEGLKRLELTEMLRERLGAQFDQHVRAGASRDGHEAFAFGQAAVDQVRKGRDQAIPSDG